MNKLRFVVVIGNRAGAQAMSLTEANVKVRLLRTRLQLREQLTQAFGDPATRVQRAPHHQH